MKSLSVVQTPKPERPKLRIGTAERPYAGTPDTSSEKGKIEARVLEAMQSIFDPELPVNIYELGLIYGIDVDDEHVVHVKMTLTAPNCPVAQSMPEDVRQKAAGVEGANGATIDVVWDPPWVQGMMTEAARLDLNL